MTRCIWLMIAVLALSSQVMVAQHRGSHGAGVAGAPTGAGPSDDLKEFNREVALQATPEQAVQFLEFAKNTALARKNAQDLLQMSQKNGDAPLQTDPLTDALDDVHTDHQRFISSLTAAQKSGLKELTKKLNKAEMEVGKGSKSLQVTGRDAKQIADLTEKLDRALGELQTHQTAIAGEMGIKKESNSQ